MAQDFKVIGYLPHYRLGTVPDIEFERLTHVNLAFANPDALGNLSFEGADVQGAIDTAHAAGCKVFISLGGGALRPEWETAWDSLAQPSRRSTFIAQIINYVNEHEFDGVDMDLEWQYVKSWYSPFVLELAAALKPLGLPLTAALPGMHRYPLVSDSALAAFDWVNMMIYDRTGPWDPQNPGQHAPLDWTSECIAYWKSQGVTGDKLTVGVPFYGYDFSTTPVTSYTYNQLVLLDTANAMRDNVGGAYWNGILTIKAKTSLALEQASGIMIWELGQDTFGANAPLSLLRAIDERIDDVLSGVEFTKAAESGLMVLYPNPVRDRLTIRFAEVSGSNADASSSRGPRIVIRDLQGRAVYASSDHAREVVIATDTWASGMYYVYMYTEWSMSTSLLIKL